METTAEGIGEILKGVAILPPRLEDAGLEDCALPPESIREAFTRAADAIKSRIGRSDEDEYEKSVGCIHDPCPSNGAIPDTLVGVGSPTKPFCAAKEERGGDGTRDEVVVVGASDGETYADRIVVLGGDEEEEMGGKKSCVVDGVDGLENKGYGKEENGIGDEDDNDEKPLLVEGLI